MYNECIQLTRQFAFCPNAFRVDLYKGCGFGCKYCFANMDWTRYGDRNSDVADITKIQKLFYKALETDKESKDILVELIRRRVPIHCGGMSDPFQALEWEYHLTEQFVDISNAYSYPVQFSTKTSTLPSSLWSKLNSDIHAFQVSMIGWNEEYVRKWEKRTPAISDRLEFVKYLRDNGFWCSVRIQPIIDIEECEKLCYNLRNIPSYVTLEHLKTIYDVSNVMNYLLQDVSSRYVVNDRNKLQFRRDVKIKNIKRLKLILNSNGIKVGVGDNDLHYLSDSRCCCGTDCINKNFNNYLKYNLTYMCTGEFSNNEWVPKCNARKHVNDQKYGNAIHCKTYTNDYVRNHRDYLGPRQSSVLKKLFGVALKRLF